MPVPGASLLRLAVLVLIAVVGLAAVAGGEAQGGATATVEVRVWQHVENGRDIYVNARAVGGAWAGLTELALDDGFSTTGRFRFGDVSFEVPLANYEAPVPVEVRVWQDILNDSNIHVGTRPAGGSWRLERLPLDDGFSRNRRYHYGDTRLEAPLPGGGVTTLAGQPGLWGYADGRGDDVRFGAGRQVRPHRGLAVDSDGSVVLADRRAVRRILPDGTVTTIAGGSTHGSRDGPAETAQFQVASDVAIHPDGSIYVADSFAARIRKITPEGMITTVAETGSFRPSRLALAPDGGLYMADHTRIKYLSPSGELSPFVGGGGELNLDGPKANVGFSLVRDIAVDAKGTVYVLDGRDFPDTFPFAVVQVRKISTDGWVSTVFRSHWLDAEGLLVSPAGLAVTDRGDIYLTNTARHQVVRVVDRDTLEAVAGTGADGFLDGGRDQARFSWPGQLALGPEGALVVVDHGDSVLRVVHPNGEGEFPAVPHAPVPEVPLLEGVSALRLAGSARGYADGSGDAARFYFPRGIALDAAGDVIVADAGNDAVRRVSRDGTVTTLAGGNGEGNRDGPGDIAQFAEPIDVAVGPGGFLYVVDKGTARLRRIEPDGTVGPGWEGEPSIRPSALATAPDGSLVVSEGLNPRIVRIAAGGVISSVLPPGVAGLHFDLAVDAEGAVFWVDSGSDLKPTALRRVDPDGTVSTLLEERPGQYGGVFSRSVAGLAVAPDGTLYLADSNYRRIIRISPEGEVAVVFAWSNPESRPRGILITPEGSLIVSDQQEHEIWEITLPDEEAEQP